MTRARESARLIGNNTFTIDTNNAVGVGSTIPDAKFDINGNLFVTGITSTSNLNVTGVSTLGGSLDVNGTNHDINGAIALDHVTISGITTISSNLDVNGTNHDINGAIALDHVTISGIATVSSNLDVNGANHDINGAIALDHVTASGIVTANSFNGTVPSSNLSGALPALDGSALTNLNIPASFDWRDSSLF
jgi:hypothetical protein